MKKLLILPAVFFLLMHTNAQYRNDNVSFKTVYPQDLCNKLKKHPGYLLLDVRTPGEYDDSSSMGMNIGHLAGARNINVRELGARIKEVNDYKSKPVFVYCSHSQRSRRASKMLADSGFTNVININGGMTAIQQLPYTYPCLKQLIHTNLSYKVLNFAELCSKMSGSGKDIFILDVRSDSAFSHISSDPKENAYGILRNSHHISLSDIPLRMNEIPRDKEIIIIDLYGDDAAKAAVMLRNKNYSSVSILPEGVERYAELDKTGLECMKSNYISPVAYKLISAPELGRFAITTKDFLALDVRSPEEFSNKHTNSWQNLGHMVNAVNIPVTGLQNQLQRIEQYKSKPVIVYGFGASSTAYDAANTLTKNGFTNVMVLTGGLFSIRWTAANVKGNRALFDLVTDIPQQNL